MTTGSWVNLVPNFHLAVNIIPYFPPTSKLLLRTCNCQLYGHNASDLLLRTRRSLCFNALFFWAPFSFRDAHSTHAADTAATGNSKPCYRVHGLPGTGPALAHLRLGELLTPVSSKIHRVPAWPVSGFSRSLLSLRFDLSTFFLVRARCLQFSRTPCSLPLSALCQCV